MRLFFWNIVGVLSFAVSIPAIDAADSPTTTPAVGCETHYLPDISPEVLQARQKLEQLCPHLTPQQVQDKLAAIPECFMFYRSFVSLFYHAIESSPQHAELFATLQNHKGWLFGDVHPENFGVVLNRKGAPVFMVNDWDDGVRGNLYYDLLRLITSVPMSDAKIDPEKLIKAYIKGLDGKSLEPGPYISSLIKKAESKGRRVKSSATDETGKKLVRNEDTSEIASDELAEIERVLKLNYGTDFELRDAVRMKRVIGGSGGLDRIEVLVKTKGTLRSSVDDKDMILEFKELAPSGATSVVAGGPSTPRGRMAASIRRFPDGDASDVYSIRRLRGKDYLIRPRWAGNLGVKLAEIPARDLLDTLTYEANTLGRQHMQNADNPEAYRQAIKSFPSQTLIDEANRIAAELKAFFKEVH